jgi:hypothetical protein
MKKKKHETKAHHQIKTTGIAMANITKAKKPVCFMFQGEI